MPKIQIQKITYYSPDTHYCVFIDMQGTTFVGNIYQPFESLTLNVESHSEQSVYGVQQKITTFSYELSEPINYSKYLSSGYFKGLGEKTALKIVQFSTGEIAKLEVSSFKHKKSTQWQADADQYLSTYKTINALSGVGFQISHVLDIVDYYPDKTLEKIQENPYALYRNIRYLSFELLDKYAQSLNFSRGCRERIYAGLHACIEDYCQQTGDNYIEFNQLYAKAYQFLEVDDGIIYSFLNHFLDEKLMFEINIANKLYVTTSAIYQTEVSIAKHIHRLSSHLENFKPLSYSVSETTSFTLSELQAKAIDTLLKHKVAILTGLPGTGKSTLIKHALSAYRAKNPKAQINISTPTGKAAQRLNENQTEFKAFTNHKLLTYLPTGKFLHNEANPLTTDLLVIDEMSMVDMFMMLNLLKALPDTCQVWFIGDPNQLPSVELGQVLEDLIESQCLPHVHLTEVFRQAENSKVLDLALSCLNKKSFSLENSNDFYFVEKYKEEDIAQTALDLYLKSVKAHQSLETSQILCPQRSSIAGVSALNESIQRSIHKNNRNALRWKEQLFYKGDKVINTVNDYDKNVFNGDCFVVEEVDDYTKELVLKAQMSCINFQKRELEKLELSYALTVHKFQGSECDTVIIPLTRAFYHMLTPRWLYTAFTRAKSKLILIGAPSYLYDIIKTKTDPKRLTLLTSLLQETFLELNA